MHNIYGDCFCYLNLSQKGSWKLVDGLNKLKPNIGGRQLERIHRGMGTRHLKFKIPALPLIHSVIPYELLSRAGFYSFPL